MVLIRQSLLALFPQCSFAWYPSYATGPDGLNYPYPQPQTVGDDWRGKELQQAMEAMPQTVTYQVPPAYPGAPPTYETVTYQPAPSPSYGAAPYQPASSPSYGAAPRAMRPAAPDYYGTPAAPEPTLPQPDSTNQCMPSQYPMNVECASLPDDSHPPVEPYVANHNKNPGVTRHRRDQYRGGKPTERPGRAGMGKMGRKKVAPDGNPDNYYYADGGDAAQGGAPGGGKAAKGGDANQDASGKGGKDGKKGGKDADGKKGGKDAKGGGKDAKGGGKDAKGGGKDGKKGGKDTKGASGGKGKNKR